MANDSNAFASAIYTVLGAGSATPAAYYALAPTGSTPPYTIFQRMTGADEYTFNAAGVAADYMVKVVSNRQWPGEAMTAYGSVHATLQNAGLTIDGYTALRCERRTTIEYQDNDRFWHIGGIYRVEGWQG